MWSELGRGTIFKIFFPKSDQEAFHQSVPAESEKSTGSETILVAEDQPAIRELISAYLKRLGYNVLTASDGEAALRMVASQQKSVDLVITDLLMPNMGGRELAARMAQLYPATKVIFMSGYPDHEVRREEGLTEEVQILQKPFSLRA